MSCVVESISDDTKYKLRINTDKGSLDLYSTLEGYKTIPLGYWYDNRSKLNRIDIDRVYEAIQFTLYPSQLRILQQEALGEALEHLLSSSSCYIKGGTGVGKTLLTICLIHKIRLKAAILMHSTTYIDQWINEFNRVSDAKIYVVPQGATIIKPGYDIYIIMIGRCSNINIDDLSEFGIVIVEEAKYMCTMTRLPQILRFFPYKLIGICAEDERDDEFNSVFDLLFGKDRIVKGEIKPLTIYKVDMPMKPRTIIQTGGKYRGRPDWTKMASEFYETCDEYNQAIANLLMEFSQEHKIIALSIRVKQVNILYQMLSELGASVAKYSGSIKSIDNVRIVLAIRQKGEIGFDARNQMKDFDGIDIDMVAFVSSMKTKLQGVGRARAALPTIVEFIPDHKICQNHWIASKKFYDTRHPTYEYFKYE